MKVFKLTSAQKKQLLGVEFTTDNYFNPFLNGDGNWVISSEEVNQTTNENFTWVKDLPQIEYIKPTEN